MVKGTLFCCIHGVIECKSRCSLYVRVCAQGGGDEIVRVGGCEIVCGYLNVFVSMHE